MLSEKLITMISGVMTLRNMLRRKSNQPSAPSASTMAISGGPAPMIMNDSRRKNRMAISAPAAKPNALLDQPIALHRIADLKLHHRHPGEARRQPCTGEVVVDCLLNLADDVAQATAGDDLRIKREHDQRQPAVLRQ